MKFFFSTAILLLLATPSHGAPIPGTSSSEFMKPRLGIYKSKMGFQIMAEKTSWIQVDPPKKTKFIETVYRSPQMRHNTHGTLTVRVDRLKKNATLSRYVKRWIKEYPKYGYDVLGSKKFKSGGKKGYVIDLINSKKKRQLRQVIYLQKRVAVLMTCRDHLTSFNDSLKECNKIVKKFSWNKRKAKVRNKKKI